MTFKCRFLGAAEDIGRLGFVLETDDHRMLYDYGIAPDKPPQYPLEAPEMDQVFLTHAHMDHSGMVPWLASRYEAGIMTTPPTAEVSKLMHKDSLKIARAEGFPEPFSDDDIEATDDFYEPVRFGEPQAVGELEATFHSAGHIPGAGQVDLETPNGNLIFTGDLFTRPQRLVGAGDPHDCDVLCIETTYAGREHPPRNEVEREYLDFVDDVTRDGGVVVTAAFAVGRAQEIALVLAGRGYNVWMDGMARKVSDIYGGHPDFLADPARYQKAMGDIKMVYHQRGRHVAMREADVIITTSGMLEGGPILFYADQIRNDPRSAIALTGYQVRGTNGRRLMDEGVLDLDPHDPGRLVRKMACQVGHFDFSAHAGHQDLVEFCKDTGADDIVLFHGDNREALVPDLQDFAEVHLPERGETFVIA